MEGKKIMMSIRGYGSCNRHKADLNMKVHIKSCSLATAGSEGSTGDILQYLLLSFKIKLLEMGNSVRILSS